jgi:hypothetical protein
VTVPAGTFAAAADVDLSDDLTADMRDSSSFPANSGVLLGALIIEGPAGVPVNSNITVQIALDVAQPTNRDFTIFTFNEAANVWQTTATSGVRNVSVLGQINAGNFVTFVAPTAGMPELDVTYGVFQNLWQDDGGGGGVDPNNIPEVTLTASATTVDTDVDVTLTATATDADGDALTFNWTGGGTFGTAQDADGTSEISWSSADAGVFAITVSANDGNGGVATDTVTITVEGEEVVIPNDPPAFDGEISGDVAAPVAGQMVILSATATDPDNDPVTLDWSGPGSFANASMDDTGAASVEWTPDAAGDATVTATASDGTDTATATYTVTVGAMPTEFDFVGYDGCLGCHSDKGDEAAETGWFSTNHADAMQRNLGPDNAYAYRNPHCYDCHALGYDPNDSGVGFIDLELTPEFANIQCESCHGGGANAGMGSGHKNSVWNPLVGMVYDEAEQTWVPDHDFDSTNGVGCGICHEGARHGAAEEWAESGHANFTLMEDDGTGTMVADHYLTAGYCNYCHSGQEFVHVLVDGNESRDLDLPADEEVLKEHYISCATCHDPHNSANEQQLRIGADQPQTIPFDEVVVDAGTGNICIACHNGRRTRDDYDSRVTNGSGHFGPHGNPQGAMMYGVMGADLGVGATTGSTTYEWEHPHNQWLEDNCTHCHMYNEPYESPEDPALWGHEFEARIERCIDCHANWSVEDEAAFWTWVADYSTSEIQPLLDAFVAAWPAEWKDVSDPANPVLRNRPSEEGLTDGPPTDDPTGNAYRAALWNYYLVNNDATNGVHNPVFAIDLLQKAIASVEELNGT